METESIECLIQKFLKGDASQEEIKQVDAWYASFDIKPNLIVNNTPELNQTIENKFSELKKKLGLNEVY